MRLPPLGLPPDADPPLRVAPHDGKPRCVVEHVAQHVWRHKLLWWIAVMATLAVGLQLGLGHDLHRLLYD